MFVKCLASTVVLTVLAAPAFADPVARDSKPTVTSTQAAESQSPVQHTTANGPKTRAQVKADLAAYVAAGRPGSDLYRGN